MGRENAAEDRRAIAPIAEIGVVKEGHALEETNVGVPKEVKDRDRVEAGRYGWRMWLDMRRRLCTGKRQP